MTRFWFSIRRYFLVKLLACVVLPVVAESAPEFAERPGCLSLSHQGTWFAFSTISEPKALFCRSPRSRVGKKLTGLDGDVERVLWINDSQFVVQVRTPNGSRLVLMRPTGGDSNDFTPPGTDNASIIESQVPPCESGVFYFTANIKNIPQIYTLDIPKDSELIQYKVVCHGPNILNITNWLFAPRGELLGGISRQGAEDVLFVPGRAEVLDQAAWVNVYSARIGEMPNFSGYGSQGDRLTAFGYGDATPSSITTFDLQTRLFLDPLRGRQDSDIEGILLSPDRTTVDAVYKFDRGIDAKSMAPKFKKIYKVIKNAVGYRSPRILALSGNYSAAIVVSENSDYAPRYWYVDLAGNSTENFWSVCPSAEAFLPLRRLEIHTRDNHYLPCWELNAALENESTPIVVYLDGGPFLGTHSGWNSMFQYLSKAGFHVLTVNYRGSVGYGKEFYNIGIREVSRGMSADVEDAINFVNSTYRGHSIVLMGYSFGGYLSLRVADAMGAKLTGVVVVNPLLSPKAFFERQVSLGASVETANEMWWRWFGNIDFGDSKYDVHFSASNLPVVMLQSGQDEQLGDYSITDFVPKEKRHGVAITVKKIEGGHDIRVESTRRTIVDTIAKEYQRWKSRSEGPK